MNKKLESFMNQLLLKVENLHAPGHEKDEFKILIRTTFQKIDKDYGQQTLMGGM